MAESASGPVALITGGSRGIGAGVAVSLAGSGMHVVIVARDSQAARRTRQRMREASPEGRGDFLPADLSRMEQVTSIARDCLERFAAPDLLLHGAAAVPSTRTVTPDGFETQWAVNHLAPFLLSTRLGDGGGPPVRTLSIASKLHRNGRMQVEEGLFEGRGYDSKQTYADTKLANVLFSRALAARLEGTDRSSACLHPGVAATGLLQDLQGASSLSRAKSKLAQAVRRVEPWGLADCVATVSRLALGAEQPLPNGAYWEEGAVVEPSEPGRNAALGEALWAVSERALAPWL
ncbi:MAG: SDR family NAD(P)-dependent oxidoreductase [Longimicrobiales bacterium]